MWFQQDLKDKKFDELNRQIEQMLRQNNKISNIVVKELNKYLLFKFLRTLLLFCSILLTIILLLYYVPLINWNFSAIGRILMVKTLVLWDWTYLYNSDCLVRSLFDDATSNKLIEHMTSEKELFVLNTVDCAYCENIDRIPSIWQTSYTELHQQYLIRNYPIIIEDSYDFVGTNFNFTNKLFGLSQSFMTSNPCNLQSNIVKGHNQNLNEFLRLVINIKDGWFVHFRNCDFATVKATRELWTKPYYYPLHIQPYQSSWILMSESYHTFKAKALNLQGLIIVTQIEGNLDIHLQPRDLCLNDCESFDVQLQSGETLLFMADNWTFAYYTSAKEKSITFITEFEYDL